MQKEEIEKVALLSSKIITILIYFHHSGFRTFKDYYNVWIRGFNGSAFKKLVSYHRFLELSQRHLLTLFAFTSINRISKSNGVSFIALTPIKVCNNRRIAQTKYLKQDFA